MKLWLTGILVLLCAAMTPAYAQDDSAPASADRYLAESTNEILLQQGTAMRVRILEHLNSQFSKEGEQVRWQVLEDVKAQGVTVIPEGSIVYGRTGKVRPAKGWGKKGRLDIELSHVIAGDGLKVEVSGSRDYRGKGKGGETVAAVYLMGPLLGGGVKGQKVRVDKNSLFDVYVAEDTVMRIDKIDEYQQRVNGPGKVFFCAEPAVSAPADMHALDQGTPVQLRLLELICSQQTKEGEFIAFETTAPITVDGVTIVEAGAPARGYIGNSRAAKGWGRKGRIDLEIVDVQAVDGNWIPLMGTRDERGDGNAENVTAGVFFLGLAFGGALKGSKVTINKGTEITVYTHGNHWFTDGSSSAPRESIRVRRVMDDEPLDRYAKPQEMVEQKQAPDKEDEPEKKEEKKERTNPPYWDD